MRRTRTRSKLEVRNPRHKSAFSFSENEMMSFGLFASSSSSTSSSSSSSPSSSSSSSNLSPLAPPFTVGRSNPNKFNLGTKFDSHFNFNGKSDGVGFWSSSSNFQTSTTSQGLLADSTRTATVPSTYSTFPNPNPITITAPGTYNRSSIPAVNLSTISPNKHVTDASFSSTFTTSSAYNRSSVPAVNLSVTGFNQHVNDASFSSAFTTSSPHNRSSVPAVSPSAIGPNRRVIDASFSSPFNVPSTHNWSSMNSNVKAGLEPVNPPAGHLFGVNPNTQPHKWSLGIDVGDNDAPMMPLDFNLAPSRSFLQDYGSSQVTYSHSMSGSKYSGQTDGSQGKEDSSLFGPAFSHPATREEKNIGPSIIGKSHGGVVSSGFSNEHTFTWDDYYPFETESVLYDSSNDHISPPMATSYHISPSMTTKSLDISCPSVFSKNNLLVSHNPLKEMDSCHTVGFDCKSSLTSQVPDINSTEEVNSAANLDHHNPGEDSPCWKGAPTPFSSSGSQEQGSSQHPMKKLQNSSTSLEDVLLHIDQSMVENAANVVTSESLDVNTVVKALNNLSELLLRLYSKDECELKEQDHKAIDHVVANLNVCISRKIQQVNPVQKCSSPQQITSNVPHEAVHLSSLHQERNNDQFGNNIEELESSYVRDESVPKNYNMVQKIKRVLEEDLECEEDLPAGPLLYKNLWLEAEAELCLSSYRNRLHRAKREIGKSKALDLSEVPSDIKKISISDFSSTAAKLLPEVAGSKTLSTHASNISLPTADNDDIEKSVMARFSILKRREESNPVNMAEKESADVEASGNKIQTSGMASEKPHLQHLLDTDDVVVMHTHGNQKMQNPLATEHVDHAVLARLNILKSRGEVDPVNSQVSAEGSMMQNEFGSLTGYSASSLGWEYVVEG